MQLIIPIIIGLTLGLLGGGGTILTVPALVYLYGYGAKEAIAMSLFIVGVSSLISAVVHIYKRNISLICTLIFGSLGMIGSFLSVRFIVPLVSESTQIVLFALAMLLFSFVMIKDLKPSFNIQKFSSIKKCFLVASAGFCVGMLTGLIGVGGGFLIVPGLIFLLGLDMKKAVGSSFLVIAMQSFTALAAYSQTVLMSIAFLVKFTGFVIVGSFVGIVVSNKINSILLKKLFGVLLLVLSSVILIEKIF